ncbi:MAG TPA: flavodoxin domain-containing protein, partial [Candidatus Marinimicrobia bacterium]|nr:flavodoxin domain-containing protein [Candidatus Neomarinimicrobiota bacterium]
MSNILILYDSKTGNTAKMAELVALGARKNGKHNVRILHIDNAGAEDIRWCDGIALGSPTNMGLISWKMKKFWDDLGDELWGKIEGKIGCAFSSS